MPRPPAAHGTTNRWRTGCQCDLCSTAHNVDLRGWRRARADARFPPAQRALLLRLVRSGHRLPDAAEQVGVTVQAVNARSRIDPAWRERLDAALMRGRDPDLPHGSETAWRHGRCRCPECRVAHHS